MPELTGQTAGWLDQMRAGDQAARERLIEHACGRLRGLARKMLRQYPRVHRWEATDDVFVEAVTRLHGALAVVQPESPRHFYNLAAMQIRRVLVDLARRYYGPEGLGSHHDTAAGKPEGLADRRYEKIDISGEPATLAGWEECYELVLALPDEDRETFDLLYVNRLTQEEAAKTLGVTARTVRRRWRETRYRLQKALGARPRDDDAPPRRPVS
jgi:RNA polymerase sigma-70 factor (ECF subfamily)